MKFCIGCKIELTNSNKGYRCYPCRRKFLINQNIEIECKKCKNTKIKGLKCKSCVIVKCTIKNTCQICNVKISHNNSHRICCKCKINKASEKNIEVKCKKCGTLKIKGIECIKCSKERKKNYLDNNPLRKAFLKNLFDCEYKEVFEIYKTITNCIYCNVKIYKEKSFRRLADFSIDRIDSSIKKHTIDNIVFSCVFCNGAKNCVDKKIYIDFINGLKGNTGYIEKYKNETDKRWVYKCTTNSRQKNTPLSSSWVRNQFKKQEGKCFYSSLKMITSEINRFPFKPSIERLDNSLPHTEENCVLVCLGINLGRNKSTLEELKKHLKLIKDN